MKKLILLFLLMFSGVTFAQKDEVYDWTKTTVTLTGNVQQISANIYQKIVWIDNRGSDSTVNYFKNRNGVADSTKGIPVYGRADEKIYNFTDTCIWIKGSAGQTVTIYILKGTGRGIERSSGINQAQMSTALASYYTKSQIDTSTIVRENQQNTLTENLKGTKVALSNLSYSYAPDGSIIIMSDTSLVIVNPKVNKNISTWAQMIDTACYRIRYTPTGKMMMMWTDLTGTTYGMDSTGKWSFPADVTAKNDFINFLGRYLVLGFNASATTGIAMNATADGVLRIRNAGVSADATVQMATLILTGVPTYADNAAAISGGLTAGKIYRTSTGVMMIVY